MPNEKPLNYSVLVYEDEYGLWLKIPEFGLQVVSDDVDVGLGILEEHFDFLLDGRGEDAFRSRIRSIRRVEKVEYGPTEVELQEQGGRDEYAEGPLD